MKKVKDDFFDRAQTWLPDLQRYIAAKLKQAEAQGLLPKHMYSASELSDAVLLELYKERVPSANLKSVKVRAFSKAKQKLDELMKRESVHQKEIPLGEIIDNELRLMNEAFSTDGDGDLLPLEELDDISYHQEDYKKQYFLLSDDTRRSVYRALGIEAEPEEDETEKVEYFLRHLPEETRNIFELYTFGSLPVGEIAGLLSLNEENVEHALVTIRQTYKSFVKTYSR